MKQPCQKWQGCWCYGLAQGCGRCRIASGEIETEAEIRGGAQREQGGHRGAEREGRREGLYVVISTSSPINGDPFELTAASCGAYVQRRVFFRPA